MSAESGRVKGGAGGEEVGGGWGEEVCEGIGVEEVRSEEWAWRRG